LWACNAPPNMARVHSDTLVPLRRDEPRRLSPIALGLIVLAFLFLHATDADAAGLALDKLVTTNQGTAATTIVSPP
jgi:hypothetical protein